MQTLRVLMFHRHLQLAWAHSLAVRRIQQLPLTSLFGGLLRESALQNLIHMGYRQLWHPGGTYFSPLIT